MKDVLGIALSLAMMPVAGTTVAQEPGPKAWDLQAVAAASRSIPVLPSPGELRDLERWLYKGDNYSVPPARTDGSRPHKGERMGVVGLVSWRYFQGARVLYSCDAWGSRNRFTSLDSRCEGQQADTVYPTLGHVASTQLPDTVPLYRCRRINVEGNWLDHYDSTDVHCEGAAGAVNDGLLGFIWGVK